MSNSKNFIIPGIILIFFSLILGRDITIIKYIFSVGISILVASLFFLRIDKLDVENRKKILMTFLIFLFQLVFILMVLFKGIPILPFFVSPFNNLYFYGIIFSSIIATFIKNKKFVIFFIFSIWGIIFMYQLLFQ